MSESNPRMVIIGGGAIGTALAGACLSEKLCTPETLEIIEVAQSQQAALKKLFGCIVTSDPHPGISRAQLIILAVKPADSGRALEQIAGFITPANLILSVMAGVRTDQITQKLGGAITVCRAMPNLGAQYRSGISGFFLPPEVTQTQAAFVRAVLESCGKVIQVKEESALDAITAISGSGPAYFFLLGEFLIDSAMAAGFSAEESRLLARETMRAALVVWDHQNALPGELRARVTSKGGTTAAAIRVLEESHWRESFLKAVEAAKKRAEELSAASPV